MVVGTISDVFGAALQGQENLTWQSLGALVNKVLVSVLGIFLILGRAPLWAIAAAGIPTGLVSLGLYVWPRSGGCGPACAALPPPRFGRWRRPACPSWAGPSSRPSTGRPTRSCSSS